MGPTPLGIFIVLLLVIVTTASADDDFMNKLDDLVVRYKKKGQTDPTKKWRMSRGEEPQKGAGVAEKGEKRKSSPVDGGKRKRSEKILAELKSKGFANAETVEKESSSDTSIVSSKKEDKVGSSSRPDTTRKETKAFSTLDRKLWSSFSAEFHRKNKMEERAKLLRKGKKLTHVDCPSEGGPCRLEFESL